MAKAPKEVPVYCFTGFLDAGKTRFMQDTLEDERFNRGERTLLLLCEQGDGEYDPETFSGKNVFIEPVDAESDITPENLQKLLDAHDAERVLVEYNGMWMLDTLFQKMPENWAIYQEFLFADARSFASYNANMRQLVYDKLKTCELVVFNRCDESVDRMELHKIVRGVSRRTDIAYEAPDGSVNYDEIVDPLPFDLDAPVVDIKDRDYALFYRDLSDDVSKYDGKTVHYKGMVAKSPKLPDDCFVFGRQLMTCCVNDIQFAGLICLWPQAKLLAKGEWITVTAHVDIRYHKGYGRKGPVLTVTDVAHCDEPEQPVATFY
jgi:G3E family GTPase